MSLQPSEFARRDAAGVEVRPEPVRLSWRFDRLPTIDNHLLTIRISCAVRLAESATDRKMLAETLLSSRTSLSQADLAEHFRASLEQSIAAVVARSNAAQVVAESLTESSTAELRRAAFMCGLELLNPVEVLVEAPTLTQRRLEEVSEALHAQRQEAQSQRIRRAADLLADFERMRTSLPQLSPGQVLSRFDPAEHGEILDSLLAGSERSARPSTLWCVSGTKLVRAGADSRQLDVEELPQDFGPLRSVRVDALNGAQVLLIGARSGVFVRKPDASSTRFVASQCESQLGFNGALVLGSRLLATHGALGLVEWPIEDPAAGRVVFEPALESQSPPELPASPASVSPSQAGIATGSAIAPGCRNLLRLDDESALLSSGSQLLLYRSGQVSEMARSSPAMIVAVLADALRVFVVRDDGSVEVLSRSGLDTQHTLRTGAPVSAAATLPWFEQSRLLLALREGGIHCLGVDDDVVTRYVSPHRHYRTVAATAGTVAAISPDRQRVITWNVSDGHNPARELHVASLTRHRVADMALSD